MLLLVEKWEIKQARKSDMEDVPKSKKPSQKGHKDSMQEEPDEEELEPPVVKGSGLKVTIGKDKKKDSKEGKEMKDMMVADFKSSTKKTDKKSDIVESSKKRAESPKKKSNKPIEIEEIDDDDEKSPPKKVKKGERKSENEIVKDLVIKRQREKRKKI